MPSVTPTDSRPNFVIILADDMGFSDIGAYGSEIGTPSLDRLARRGLTFTQMYNYARCCPSRAALLSGCFVLALACNVVRVTILVLIVQYSGVELLETDLHELSGMATFAVVIALLFAIAGRDALRAPA